MTTEKIIEKIKEYKQLKAYLAEINDELKAVEHKLITELDEQKTDELSVDIFKVKYKTVKTSRLDTKALKSNCLDIYNTYLKQSEYKRFTVSLRG